MIIIDEMNLMVLGILKNIYIDFKLTQRQRPEIS